MSASLSKPAKANIAADVKALRAKSAEPVKVAKMPDRRATGVRSLCSLCGVLEAEPLSDTCGGCGDDE